MRHITKTSKMLRLYHNFQDQQSCLSYSPPLLLHYSPNPHLRRLEGEGQGQGEMWRKRGRERGGKIRILLNLLFRLSLIIY